MKNSLFYTTTDSEIFQPWKCRLAHERDYGERVVALDDDHEISLCRLLSKEEKLVREVDDVLRWILW